MYAGRKRHAVQSRKRQSRDDEDKNEDGANLIAFLFLTSRMPSRRLTPCTRYFTLHYQSVPHAAPGAWFPILLKIRTPTSHPHFPLPFWHLKASSAFSDFFLAFTPWYGSSLYCHLFRMYLLFCYFALEQKVLATRFTSSSSSHSK